MFVVLACVCAVVQKAELVVVKTKMVPGTLRPEEVMALGVAHTLFASDDGDKFKNVFLKYHTKFF